MKEIPYYFARTYKNGTYTIRNIKIGDYKVFALKDQNLNYVYDLPNEEIGFVESMIRIDTIIDGFDLKIFDEQETRDLEVLDSWNPVFGKLRVAFTMRADSVGISLFGEQKIELLKPYIYSKKLDTVSIWISNTDVDSVKLLVSQKGIPMDTLSIAVKRINMDSLKAKKYISLSHDAKNVILLDHKIMIKASQPIDSIIDSLIILLEDTVDERVFPEISYKDSSHQFLELIYPWKESMTYNLSVNKGALIDIYGLNNLGFSSDFNTKSRKDYGNIHLILNNLREANYIVQLLSKNNNVSRETSTTIAGGNTIRFDLVSPGAYKIRIIEDLNRNEKWDEGKYLSNRQPETVYNYPNSLDIKANWDIEQEIDFEQ